MRKIISFYSIVIYFSCSLSFSESLLVGEKIKKVIVLMMENRSFNNIFAFMRAVNPDVQGCLPNMNGCSNPTDPQDVSCPTYTVGNQAAYLINQGPKHSTTEVTRQVYGKLNGDLSGEKPSMNGFIDSYASVYNNATLGPEIMQCYALEHVPVIYSLAQEFALFDGWFSSVPGPTMPNRAYAQSATSHGMNTNDPTTIAKGLPQKTIFRQIEEMGLDYRIYFQDVPTALMFKDIRHRDARPRLHSMEKFFSDAAEGNLPDFTWLDPSYFDTAHKGATDQHPGHDFALGEALIGQVYAAVRSSPQWNETALIITYDEHGGFFDHVAPMEGVPNPDGINSLDDPFNYTRLGVRVPTIVVSPWVKKGLVVHGGDPNQPQYEHSSIAATVVHKIFKSRIPGHEPKYLTKRDAWAKTFEQIFSTVRSETHTEIDAVVVEEEEDPREDCPLTMPFSPLHRDLFPGTHPPLDGRQPLSDLHKDLIAIVYGAVTEMSQSGGGGSSSSSSSAVLPAGIEDWTEEDGAKYVEMQLKSYLLHQ